jgi:hypothetical protein
VQPECTTRHLVPFGPSAQLRRFTLDCSFSRPRRVFVGFRKTAGLYETCRVLAVSRLLPRFTYSAAFRDILDSMGMHGTQWFSMGLSAKTGICRRFVTQKLNRIDDINHKWGVLPDSHTIYGCNM